MKKYMVQWTEVCTYQNTVEVPDDYDNDDAVQDYLDDMLNWGELDTNRCIDYSANYDSITNLDDSSNEKEKSA